MRMSTLASIFNALISQRGLSDRKFATSLLQNHVQGNFEFYSNVSCNFAKNIYLKEIQDGDQDGEHVVEQLLP